MMFEIRRPSVRSCRFPLAVSLAIGAFTLGVLSGASPTAAQTTDPVDVYHSTNDDGVHPNPSEPPGCVSSGGSDGGSGVANNVLIFELDASSKGATLESDLSSLGHTVTRSTSLPADLSAYAAIWHVDAFNAISAANQDALRAFIQSGGGVHLTGERPCCETLNASVQTLVNSVVVGGGITVGGQGDLPTPYSFNPTAVGGVTAQPNLLTSWVAFAPGGIAGLDAENALVSSGSVPVGAAWVASELVGGMGRLTVLMDWNWFDASPQSDRRPVIENIQNLLGSGGGSGGLSCVLNGGSNEALNLWIDGGSNSSGGSETVCKFGADGGRGDNLCGADMLIEMTGGQFTSIAPTIDTLVCNPSCADCDADETGICSLPPGTTSIRMNFRRGEAFAPPAAPPAAARRVATLFVNSSGNTVESPSRVFASGVGAAGANLQLRRIANAADVCTGFGAPFSCCTGANTGNGEWPCGPRLIATGAVAVPEPAQILQLLGGLVGLGCLYRLRGRA